MLNKPIPGYNNKLKVSDASMKFVLNADINRVTIKKSHIDMVGDEKPKRSTKTQHSKKTQSAQKNQ